MDLLHSIRHPSRLHDVTFCRRVNGEGEVMLAGAEDHKTTVYSMPKDATSPIVIAEMTGHSNRSVLFNWAFEFTNLQMLKDKSHPDHRNSVTQFLRPNIYNHRMHCFVRWQYQSLRYSCDTGPVFGYSAENRADRTFDNL